MNEIVNHVPQVKNPLASWYRQPKIYVKLPSGGNYYPEGAIDLPDNKEIPIYPMTAIDEITSKTPDALFNGIAITEIIKSWTGVGGGINGRPYV